MSDSLSAEARVWHRRILVSTWLSYAGFYFCRKNFFIVKTSIHEALELSTVALAHIFSAYFIAYFVGQFLTAYLGRRIKVRRLLLGGMACTLTCNVIFGFCYMAGPIGYWPMLLFMIINGLAQATGWAGNIGVLSSWLVRETRGRTMAIWATSYQLGSILAKVFATFMLGLAGATWSFWGAALVMAGIWVFFYFFERDNPEDVGLPPLVEEEQSTTKGPSTAGGLCEGWDRNVVNTIFIMGSCYFVFKFLRYALDSWSPWMIVKLFAVNREQAGYLSTLFDWVGFVGVLFAGWLSDRMFHGRRYQTILLMTVGMLLAFIFLALSGTKSLWLFCAGLSICGFMLMGPDSLLSGVGAMDVGGRRGAVTAAAIINGIGSAGPIVQEELIGWILTRPEHMTLFYLLIAVSVLGVLGTAYLALRSWRNISTL